MHLGNSLFDSRLLAGNCARMYLSANGECLQWYSCVALLEFKAQSVIVIIY